MAGELTGRWPGRYGAIFLVPALINLATLAYFLVAFRPLAARWPAPAPSTTPAPVAPAGSSLAPGATT